MIKAPASPSTLLRRVSVATTPSRPGTKAARRLSLIGVHALFPGPGVRVVERFPIDGGGGRRDVGEDLVRGVLDAVRGVGRYADVVPRCRHPLLVADLHPPPPPHDDIDLLRSVAVRTLCRSRIDTHPRNRQLRLGNVSRVQEYVRDEPVPLAPQSLRSAPLEHYLLLRSRRGFTAELIVDNRMSTINIDSRINVCYLRVGDI